MNKRILLIFITIFVAIVLSGAVSATTQNNTTCSDPIINGTVTISEYGNVRPLPNATITVNSTGSNSRVLGTTTTDANGYYSINFYSTNTQFLVTASYLGCNSVTKTVNVSQSSNPQDPNYYGTSNIQLTPKTATWNGQMGYYSSIYITYYDGYYSAGELKTSISGDSATYNAYCIDIYTTIHSGGQLLVNGPLPGTTGDLSDQVDWDKVNYIISHYAANSNLEGAAIQAAIWYFTSAQYGEYPGNDPNHPGYYQFMTNPEDAKLNTWYNPNAVRDRAWEIINSANSMNYPSTVTLEPEITRVENGSDVVITATVRDQNGNPLQNITVNFTTDKGNLSYATRTTNANGQASVTLYNVGDNSTATVTAYVTGKYGTLLYDDVNNPLQNLVCAQLLPYTLSDTSTINFDRKVDVQITQTVDKPVANVGDIVNFTITARNTHGYRNATGIIIEDIIPEGLSNVTVIPSVGTFYNNLWVIPSLASGATATLNIIGTVTASMAGLTVTNTATRVSQDQYNSLPAVASASIYTKMAMVDIDETVNTPVNVGDTVTYVVSVTNNGPDTATNIVVEDNPPCCLNNLMITPSVGTYENGIWTIPSLASGATATLTISGIATAVMAGCCTPNTATIINQTEYDPHTIGESVTKETYTKSLDITVEAYAYSKYDAWHYNVSVPFIIAVTNNSSEDAVDVIVQTPLPVGADFISANLRHGISYVYDPDTRIITWNIGTLPGKQRATFEFSFLNKSIGTKVITATAETGGQVKSGSWTVTTPNAADVEVNQISTNTNPDVGDVFELIITAKNNGPCNATGYQIDNIINSGLTLISANPSKGTFSNGTWNVGSLSYVEGVGETATLILTVQYNSPTSSNAYRKSSTTYDWDTTNNGQTIIFGSYTPTTNITVENYAYSKYDAWHYNVSVPFIIAVTNNSSEDAVDVIVQTPLPVGADFISANLRHGISYVYDPDTRIITWNIGTLPGKQRATFEYTIINSEVSTKVITATAETGGQVKSGSWTVTTPNAADVEVNQISTNTNPDVGDVFELIITAKNNGPCNATGYQIDNIINSGLTLISANPSKGTFSNGTWNVGSLSYVEGVGETATLILTVQYNSPTSSNAYRKSSTTYDWDTTNNGQSLYP